MNIFSISMLGLILCLANQVAQATATPEEASHLGKNLTPMGAERAGNADGSIPAWDGGYTKVLPNWKEGEIHPDPYADEKPLFSINGQNVDQYAAKLADSTRAMLKKYPGYRLDIYPTHRTAAAPQWVYDNTLKNATRAKTINDGYGLEGAYGGLPFPIPKDGYEMVWNMKLAWRGESVQDQFRTWIVTAQSGPMMATRVNQYVTMPYYYKDGSLQTFDGVYLKPMVVTTEPASKNGEALLVHENIDASKRSVWQYLVGQRRVRRAPSVAYDTPDFITSGIGLFDEAQVLFGPTDHHAWKLLGKQELFIPYNANRISLGDTKDLLTPNFLNPNHVRWELHRVWVVEATLLPGKRHVVSKRRYYVDEDSGQPILSDGWDAQGQLWRGSFSMPLLTPEVPVVRSTATYGTYNLLTGAYYITGLFNGLNVQSKMVERPSPSFFSPDELAAKSTR